MQKRYIYLLLFCFLLVWLSCGKTDNGLKVVQIESFRDTIVLKGERAAIGDEECYVPIIYDSLVIFSLHRLHPYAYRVYNLRSGRKLGDILMRGRGKGEFIKPVMAPQYPFSEGSEIKMWIKDFPRKLALINITRSLETGKTVVEKEYDFVRRGKANRLYEADGVFVIKDKKFLMNVSLLRSRNSDRRFTSPFYILYDFDEDKVLDTLRYRYPLDIKQYLSEDRTKIVSHAFSDDLISIYDIPTKTEMVLMHDDRQPENVYSPMSLTFKMPEYTYSGCVITANRLFALYCKNRRSVSWNEGDLSYIHIFDLKGEPLYNLVIEEPVRGISFDESTSVLYGLADGGQMYAYDLKDIL